MSLCISHKAFSDFSPDCKEAYRHTFSGKFSKSRKILIQESKKDSQQLEAFYLLGFNRFIHTLLSQSDALARHLIDSQDQWIDSLDATKDRPFKQVAKAELLAQKSIISLKLGERWSAIWGFREAYSLLEKNKENYPNFLPGTKTFWLLQAYLSQIPAQYHGVLSFLGYDCDFEEALSALKHLTTSLQTNKRFGFFEKEVALYSALLSYKMTEDKQAALDLVSTYTADFRSNPVSCILKGLIALEAKQTEEAIKTLSYFSRSDVPFPYIHYLLGKAHLYGLNPKCTYHFALFIKSAKSSSCLNDTYLKLGWWYHLQGNSVARNKWLAFIDDPSLSAAFVDKQAIKEGKKTANTSIPLLKARILFDGGFYQDAEKILLQFKEKDGLQLSSIYQLARLYTETQQFEQAIDFYKKTLAFPFDKSSYQQPVSAYHLGHIYETEHKNFDHAKIYYSKCLSYKGFPYAGLYHSKSKQGLKRIDKVE